MGRHMSTRMHQILVLAAAIAALACGGCGAGERCGEYRAASCPEGQRNTNEDDASCESQYDGACGGAWAEHVACLVESPQCNIVNDDGTETSAGSSGCSLEAYSSCLCDHEGPGSPWCS